MELIIFKRSIERRINGNDGGDDYYSSAQSNQQPFDNGFDRPLRSAKDDADFLRQRFGGLAASVEAARSARYQNVVTSDYNTLYDPQDNDYSPSDARYVIRAFNAEFAKVWKTFGNNARHADELTRGFLFAIEEFRHQSQSLRSYPSADRLERFVRYARPAFFGEETQRRIHIFLSKEPSRRHSAEFASIVRSILPRNRDAAILDSRAFDAISNAVYKRIVNVPSRELVEQFDGLVRILAPLTFGRRSRDLAMMLQTLGNQRLTILSRMLFVPDLTDIYRIVDEVLLPGPGAKSNSNTANVY